MSRVLRLALSAPLLLAACQKDAGEEGADHAEPAFHVEHAASGEAVVVLAPEAVAAAQLATAAPVAREAAEENAAFGTLIADPARVGVLRAPLAGTVVASDQGAWPAVGARLAAGATIGALAPRTAPLTTAELADLRSRVATARAEAVGTEAELAAAKSALARLKKLNALEKGVSDQAVEDAQVVVTAAEARLAAARESVAIFEQASGSAGALVLAPMELVAPRAGEVIAAPAQPGENVEAGAELVRIADLSELLADVRLESPSLAPLPKTARIVVNDGAAASFEATVVGEAPEADRLASTLRLRVRDPSGRLRPGLGVTAWLASGAAPRPAFAVPASAIVRYASRNWVYVELAAGRYARRPVTLLRGDGDVVLVAAGIAASDQVVTLGAMTLLSQEQIEAGGGEGE